MLSASRIQHEQTALRTRVQDLLNAATAVATPLLGTDAFNNSLRYAVRAAAIMSNHTQPTWSPASRHSRPATASKSRPFAIPLSGLQPDLVKAVAYISPSQDTDAAQMGQAGPVAELLPLHSVDVSAATSTSNHRALVHFVMQVWLAAKGTTGSAGPPQIAVVDVSTAQTQRHAAPAAVTCCRAMVAGSGWAPRMAWWRCGTREACCARWGWTASGPSRAHACCSLLLGHIRGARELPAHATMSPCVQHRCRSRTRAAGP